MRIRRGFISNSSSTSFTIYGAIINNELYEDLEDRYYKEIMPEKFLDLHYGDPNGEATKYLGASFDTMSMDETKSQWMNRVEDKIKELCPDANLEFGFYAESYYNG